ncbi:MAG: 2-oxoacid:ferredoxin oxidoreductase subunit beta [Myxococcales bacterium]|jgi:2-oxoglutarate ferredoxin oxidoreductase subunit beta|nr:2-oxoacid:ferredoxin oxidoreductase subunit beta [Myxococcales bacterium]
MSNVIQPAQLTRKDFATDQDVRWCPGCGDYSILANVQRVMPELGIPLDDIVWISGIGCSSRFPYYMNTYGFHTIHGRAPAIALGVKAANPKLSVWLATGDGDALSIGGNHLLHCLRRNLDVKVLLFNNRIYGLTKGQYSPTSEVGKITKSTPLGSTDQPVDPASFALGAHGSFVARSIDTEAQHLTMVLRRAAAHRGTAFTEIYQNCNVFNDGAFESFRSKEHQKERQLLVEHGKPLLFGEQNDKGLRLNPRTLGLEVVTLGAPDASGNVVTEQDVLVHDETNPALAYLLARMPFPEFPVALGVLFAEQRPTYDASLWEQNERAKAAQPADLGALLRSGNTWQV